MSRLPTVERAIVEAAERLERERTAGAPGRLGGARARWRRLSRGGRAAGFISGVVVLGAVATGSAQVAGIGPFGALDRAADMDAGLATKADPATRLELSSPGEGANWRVRAYLAENGQICLTGARGSARSGTLECHRTDAAAQAIADPQLPGSTIADFAVVSGRERRPKRLIVFGLAADGTPPVHVRVDGRRYPATQAPGALEMRVDRSIDTLKAQGRQRDRAADLLASLPTTIELRLWAAEVPAARASLRPGARTAPIVVREERPTGSGAVVDVTDGFKIFGGNADAAKSWLRRTSLLERESQPVRGAAALQTSVVRAFARPRTKADTVPARLVDPAFETAGAQPGDSRRLAIGGTPEYGPVWVIPGATTWSNSRALGALCLAGPMAIAGCQYQQPGRPRPGLTSVLCSPGLDPQMRLTFGLPPADATQARLAFAGGRRETVEVRDLLVVVRARTEGRLERVTWIAPAGELTERSWMPSRAGRDLCRPKPGRPQPNFAASGAGGPATIGRVRGTG